MAFDPFEKEFYSLHPESLIAGVDEAGRGPLAGPVSIGFTVFHRSFFESIPDELRLLNDSKLLKPEVRERLTEPVRKHSLFHTVIHISNKKIDEIGINPAIELAVIRSLQRFHSSGAEKHGRLARVLVDGNYRLNSVKKAFPDTEFLSVVKGDSRVFSIAAASVLAKVTRDRRMNRFHRYFPEYGFDRHAGYGTAQHRKVMAEIGLSPLHRKSYRLKNG